MTLQLLEWRICFLGEPFLREEKMASPDKHRQPLRSPGPAPLGWGSGPAGVGDGLGRKDARS